MTHLQEALNHEIWLSHQIGDIYEMDGKPGWKIAYYPLFEDGKTGQKYNEPRVLIEKPAVFKGIKGTDFREVPLRYLKRVIKRDIDTWEGIEITKILWWGFKK